jgi:toxin ParE1/3/4
VTTGYRLRALALEDLEAIWRYTVEQWGIDQAERYLTALFTCFDDLAINPELGRKRDEVKPGYRSFPQGRHVVFYTIVPTEIEIIGVVHQNSDVDKHLEQD